MGSADEAIGLDVDVLDLKELHYIMPIANVPSILKLGILSHREVARRRVNSMSVALPGVQERRESRVIPGARPLHEYVNLYICVLQISPAVLSLPGVVIADGNAASGPTAFWKSPSGLSKVDKDTTRSPWKKRRPLERGTLLTGY